MKKWFLYFASILTLVLVCILLIQFYDVKKYDHPAKATRSGNFNINNLNEYKIDKVIGEQLNLDKPYGLVIANNHLIVADSGKNRLLVLDYDGKIIQQIGKTGNGKVEFLRPMGIAIDKNNNIYVVDTDNNRIQVININGEFLEEIKIIDLVKAPSNTYLSDIAVDGLGNIYVSVYTNQMRLANIYFISTDRKIKKLDKKLEGLITCGNGKVFFASQMEFYKKDGNNVAGSGVNYLLEIENGKIKKTYELPYKYFAKGMCSYNNYLYLVSGGFASVDKFNLEGNYKGTLFKGDPEMHVGMSDIAVDSNENLYIVDSEKNIIYKLTRNK